MQRENNGRILLVGILAIIFAIGFMFVMPLIVMNFWNWFIVPATNFNRIGYWLSMGIGMTVTLLVKGISMASNKEKDDFSSAEEKIYDFTVKVVGVYVSAAIIFGIGALVHLGV